MKLGIIFKKEFHDKYGTKEEFRGDEINISQDREHDLLIITHTTTYTIEEGSIRITSFPVKAIQLIYLGEWNI